MIRRLLFGFVLILLVALLAGDRIAARIAAGRVADRLRTQESLSRTPKVTFGGFPFLTQALRGRYRDVHVVATDVERDGLRIASIDAHLRGVHLMFPEAMNGGVSGVPVDRVDAVALVRYADLTAALPNRNLVLSGDHGRVRMRGSVDIFGSRYSGSALGDVQVGSTRLTIVPRDITLGTGGANITLPPEVNAALTYSANVTLPFGLTLRSVTPGTSGLQLHAAGRSVVLRR